MDVERIFTQIDTNERNVFHDGLLMKTCPQHSTGKEGVTISLIIVSLFFEQAALSQQGVLSRYTASGVDFIKLDNLKAVPSTSVTDR